MRPSTLSTQSNCKQKRIHMLLLQWPNSEIFIISAGGDKRQGLASVLQIFTSNLGAKRYKSLLVIAKHLYTVSIVEKGAQKMTCKFNKRHLAKVEL